MRKGQSFAWILASILFFSPAVWTQTREPNAVGCVLCGSLIFIPIGVIVLNTALLVWVARDAIPRDGQRRDMDVTGHVYQRYRSDYLHPVAAPGQSDPLL
jgi:hypothetical protein